MSAKTSAKFTDTYIRNLKPNPPRYVWDIMLPSFGLYVGKRKKTFVIIRDKGKRASVGTYPHEQHLRARLRLKSYWRIVIYKKQACIKSSLAYQICAS